MLGQGVSMADTRKVLLVEGSGIMREALATLLNVAQGIDAVGTALKVDISGCILRDSGSEDLFAAILDAPRSEVPLINSRVEGCIE